MILYHGTSSSRLPSILQHGLVAPGRVRGIRRNWKGWRKSKNYVYLSHCFAAFYASNAQRDDDDMVILQVRVDESDLYPDEDVVARAYVQQNPGVRLETAHGIIDLRHYKHAWRASLDHLGTVAVRRVLPQDILRHRIIRGVEQWASLGGDLTISPLAFKLLGPGYRQKLDDLFAGQESAA